MINLQVHQFEQTNTWSCQSSLLSRPEDTFYNRCSRVYWWTRYSRSPRLLLHCLPSRYVFYFPFPYSLSTMSKRFECLLSISDNGVSSWKNNVVQLPPRQNTLLVDVTTFTSTTWDHRTNLNSHDYIVIRTFATT